MTRRQTRTFRPRRRSTRSVTSSYPTGFHEATSGASGSDKAGTNFDLVTGWGRPKAGIIDPLLK